MQDERFNPSVSLVSFLHLPFSFSLITSSFLTQCIHWSPQSFAYTLANPLMNLFLVIAAVVASARAYWLMGIGQS
jgi:hypothetical protein